MNRRSIAQVLAVLLFIGLLENWRTVLWVFRIRDSLGLLVGVTWLALVLGSVIGLFRAKQWGVFSLLVLVPFATVMLGIPVFPGMHLIGLRGPLALAAWNIIALLGAVAVVRTPAFASVNQAT
jgi:hypothetical protein